MAVKLQGFYTSIPKKTTVAPGRVGLDTMLLIFPRITFIKLTQQRDIPTQPHECCWYAITGNLIRGNHKDIHAQIPSSAF